MPHDLGTEAGRGAGSNLGGCPRKGPALPGAGSEHLAGSVGLEIKPSNLACPSEPSQLPPVLYVLCPAPTLPGCRAPGLMTQGGALTLSQGLL